MPLSEDRWEKLKTVVSMRETILGFFEDNPSKAYTTGEVIDHFASQSEEDILVQTTLFVYYESMLDHLVYQDKLELRQHEDEDEDDEPRVVSYFRFKRSSEEY